MAILATQRHAPLSAAAFLAAALAGATTTSLAQAPPAELHDARYCEVITVARTRLTFTVKIFNTIGFNACPQEQWTALDGPTLAKQLGVQHVKLNGPRHWILDRIEGRGTSASGETGDFGGIRMGLRATITTKVWQGTVGDKFYSPNKVRRETTYHYKAGAPVFELIAPNGDIYIMQSYAQIVDRELTVAGLPRLGERLKLPAGWKFQTRVITTDYALKTQGLAYVINDDQFNSYQRRPK